jgi:hypothetical protein
MREIIQRATAEFATTGRTLEGLAYRFNHPSSVVDPGGKRYLEAFTPSSATKSIRDRGERAFPLDYFHGLNPGSPGSRSRWAGETFGPVRFAPGPAGLEFEARLSRTRGGDEMLELLNDGALEDVSISAGVVRSAVRGGVVWRDELAIIALSLAPPGTGQHDGARVLAMRAKSPTPRLDAIRRRRLQLEGKQAQ